MMRDILASQPGKPWERKTSLGSRKSQQQIGTQSSGELRAWPGGEEMWGDPTGTVPVTGEQRNGSHNPQASPHQAFPWTDNPAQ